MINVLITGGLGFIGSAVVRHILDTTENNVIILDAMTYAATPEAIEQYKGSKRCIVEKGDVRDYTHFKKVLHTHKPTIVMHLAAESHVDRSIEGPMDFVETNVVGTVQVLEACRTYYYDSLNSHGKNAFRFHQISTDEVFGSLNLKDAPFTEQSPYQPRSPYSASKAASDHFVRAWHETYGLPVIVSNCSNNYGPWQHPEKLIPLMIANCMAQKPLPIYGTGQNIRDWLHVEDHAEALWSIATRGRLGESYNVGGSAERTNLDVVKTICQIFDQKFPQRPPHSTLISHVTDRPGHDFRYAIDFQHIKNELGWTPRHNFDDGLRETIEWYLENESWWKSVLKKTKGTKRIGLID